MLKIGRYYGPAGQQEVVKNLFRAFGIPKYSASVHEENHDIGYPGLAINSTVVELNIDDEDLSKKVEMALKNLGFSERK